MPALRYIPGSKFLKQVLILGILAIPLMILVPGWTGFPFAPRSFFSDIAISHYPNARFLLSSLAQGQFPLWSSTILSGYPFAANPLSGEWYLPGWLAYFFPLPLGFNLNILLHLWWSGLGMWLFLRASGRDSIPALGGALAWEMLPKIFAHFGAGHLTFIYAVAWTPWLFWAELVRQQSSYRSIRIVPPGVVLGLIALADLRWAAIASMAWTAFSVYQYLSQAQVSAHFGWIKGLLSPWTLNSFVCILVAAPQLIPLLEYTSLSTRAGLSLADNLTYSLQPIHLFGIFVPAFQGMAEWVIYPGCIIVVMLVWSISRTRLRKANRFWLGMLLFGLIYSMGASLPFLSFLYQLPGLNLLRVPTRIMVLFGFACAVICSSVLEAPGDRKIPEKHFWGNLSLFALCTFPWVIAVGLWAISREIPLAYVWGASFLLVGTILLIAYHQEWIPSAVFRSALIAGLVLDLGSVSQSLFTYHGEISVINEQADLAHWLANQDGLFRIYSPSYSLPQQTAESWGLPLADGVDPLQLSAYTLYMDMASGIPRSGYSVTLPPYGNGDPTTSNEDYQPSAQALGLLNVRYIASAFPLEATGLDWVRNFGGTWLYENKAFLPRAWVQPSNAEIGADPLAAKILLYQPNRIEINATGPGLLVLSELCYPGWHVYVDGKESTLQSPLGILRGVSLEPGQHTIAFSFQPLSVYLGLILACIFWGVLITGFIYERRKVRR